MPKAIIKMDEINETVFKSLVDNSLRAALEKKDIVRSTKTIPTKIAMLRIMI